MTAAPSNIAFIDYRVADYQALIDGLAEGTEWFLLNAGEDGINQMARILSGYGSLDAIHVFSHGSPGTLYLGSTVLDGSNLEAYAPGLQAIGSSLTATGDMLLYGCNVAQGDSGQIFIEGLAAATGADVAASTDLTGASALGGNWVLEESAGAVETTGLTPESYTSILPIATPVSNIFSAQGFFTTFADIAQAAYKLGSTELVGQGSNFVKPYTDEAWTRVSSAWTVLQAAQLGTALGPNTFASNAPTSISAEGIFTCNNAAAIAVVCDDALVISFRGTNDNDQGFFPLTPDMYDWLNMSGHYDELQPFVTAVDAYAIDHNIAKVYATGHSLGGAMALGYMLDHKDGALLTNASQPIVYEAVTFAAPGFIGDADSILAAAGVAQIFSPTGFLTATALGVLAANANSALSFDERIIGIEIDGDPVPDVKWAHGYTVSIEALKLEHTRAPVPGSGKSYSVGDSYGALELHSMNIYRASADALDSEIPNTAHSDATFVHGFNRSIFIPGENGINGLAVAMAVSESYPPAPDLDTTGDAAPTFSTMLGNNIITTGRGGFTDTTADYILGGAGNDTLGAISLVPHATYMIGGGDDDTYIIDSNADDVIENPGSGVDTVKSSLTYSLGPNVENLELLPDSAFAWFDANIDGTGNNLDNTLKGNDAANTLSGLGGDDTLSGNDGDDNLAGGDGNDVLGGGRGDDFLEGGDGNDSYHYWFRDDNDEISEIGGYDQLWLENISLQDIVAAGQGGTDDLVIEIDIPFYLGLNDTITIDHWYQSPAYRIEEISIDGLLLSGDDFIGLVQLIQAGGDGLRPLGDNSDQLYYGTDAPENIDMQGGNDRIYARGGEDEIHGGSGQDTLYGGLGRDLLYGEFGNDIIHGDSDNDTIYGGAGDDTLDGGSDNDFLDAGDGNDTVVGSTGADTIDGGAGTDKLIFDQDLTQCSQLTRT